MTAAIVRAPKRRGSIRPGVTSLQKSSYLHAFPEENIIRGDPDGLAAGDARDYGSHAISPERIEQTSGSVELYISLSARVRRLPTVGTAVYYQIKGNRPGSW